MEELIRKIEECGLRPSDIVRMTNGEISLPQASTWLSKLLMSASTRNLLSRLCDEKLSDGAQYAAEVSIYTISHPSTNAVVYVGATSNMDMRKSQHLLMATNGSKKPLYEWIRSLPSEPIFSEIEVCPGSNAANIRELYWISEYAKIGSIFNEIFDGDGRLPSDESVTRSMARAASISELGISPSSIVKLSDGEVSFQTAGKWLKSANPSIAVKYALMYFRLKLGSAEIFSEEPISEPRADIYDAPAILETIKEKNAKKIQAKTHIYLNTTGFPSWGADKTYKLAGTMLKVNFNGRGYNALGVTKIGDSFVIDGIPYPVSEFTNVG